MSRYLSIECDWLDQPLGADPLERLTWARIQINVAGRTATRVWDRHALAERLSIYVPAIPLARWIAANWWTLLYEPARSDQVPSTSGLIRPANQAWLRRHCLRAAESGLLLPRLCLFSDGRGVVAEWVSDDQDAHPHMPGQFVGSDHVHLPVDEAQNGMREFVSRVIARIGAATDESADALKQNWQAICGAGPEEATFCRAAARLGLDPYQSDQWQPALVDLLEHGVGDMFDRPIVADFLEAAQPETAVEVWKWVESTRAEFDLRPAPGTVPLYPPSSEDPVKSGYQLASQVRRSMGGKGVGPLDRVDDAAQAWGIGTLAMVDHDQLSSPNVRAAVGWRGGNEPIVAGPRPAHERNTRFLEARALYHAAFACRQGPRLVTDARTWEQQASRAFAAELLAPQDELVARFEPAARAEDPEAYDQQLAQDYNVSTLVVRHQLVNAGIGLGAA